MTKGELASLGFSDAEVVKQLEKMTGQRATIFPGDSARACARRREAFELFKWLAYPQDLAKNAG